MNSKSENFVFAWESCNYSSLEKGRISDIGNKMLNRRTACSNIFYCYENNNEKFANDICFCSVFRRCKENNFSRGRILKIAVVLYKKVIGVEFAFVNETSRTFDRLSG